MILEELATKQSKELEDLRVECEEWQKVHSTLSKQLEMMHEFQNKLQTRAALLLDLIYTNQNTLSDAEKEYHRMLEQKEATVRNYIEKINEVGYYHYSRFLIMN